MAVSSDAYESIADLSARIAAGSISPVEVTEQLLARIERLDGRLNTYITLMSDAARRAAREAEEAIGAGDHRGPLHGVPVAVKDLFATRGVTTTSGSLLFAERVPDHDAAVVERLRRAGAVLVGKTNLHELAFGTTSANPHYGPVRNPWDTACHPGGSSGGSAAAVAAGLAYGALGSDTGASIRQPAACCGIVGLKPTYGLVPRHGCFPLAWSMDHVGPMTRTVRDAALMLGVLAGDDPRDPASVAHPVPDYLEGLERGVEGSRIGVVRAYFFERCDPEVAGAVEAALDVFCGLGARLEDVSLPEMEAARAAGEVILFTEAAALHAAARRKRPECFSDELGALLEMGGLYTAVQYVQAQRVRRVLSEQTARALSGLDALVMPTVPIPATPIEDDPPGHASLRPRNTIVFDLVSLPAISIPCGFTSSGLPVGLQIVSKAFDEPGVLRVAHAYEQATEWHTRRPRSGASRRG